MGSGVVCGGADMWLAGRAREEGKGADNGGGWGGGDRLMVA